MAERPIVVLGVSGSVAAYKAPVVARGLAKGGCRVIPMMTRGASRFLGAATLAGITGERVRDDMFDGSGGEPHVELATAASAIVLVPATADLLARLVHGRADDIVTATVLCTRAPIFVVPAMHPTMWSHPATQRNVATLRADGVHFIGPVDGPVASGDSGLGRMSEPADVVREILAVIAREPVSTGGVGTA